MKRLTAKVYHALWTLASFLTVSSCYTRRISDSCNRHLYYKNICGLYHCDRILDPPTSQNGSQRMEALSCQLAQTDTDELTKNVFAKRFEDSGNKSSSFFDKIDKQYVKNDYCYEPVEETTSGKAEEDDPKSNRSFLGDMKLRRNICTVKPYKPNKVLRNFQKISTFVSPIFIFLPIIIFMLTREIQNVHGWTHFTNGCCVFALYISWGLRYIFFRDELIGSHRCVTFAIIQHYLNLSVFSWLVVACQDLQKLAASPPSGKSLDITKQIFQYMKLSLFGWGIPAVYMGFCEFIALACRQFGMDVNSKLASYFLPEYGRYRCFLAFNAYWLHLILPTFILFIAANVYNWKTLRILQKKNDQSIQRAVQKVNVIRNLACLKTMILASICWGCDVARSFMTAYDREGMLWLRVIFDTVIIYQTIPICIIYSCRPHILNHLESKFPGMTCAIEASRKYFRVKRKEVDPDIVTQLRVHRKSDADASQIPENYFQETGS